MCKILLSINPQHVESIMSGKKTVEYRKARCRHDVDKIVIYSTYPVMQIVGEAIVKGVIEGEPANVWAQTAHGAGITKAFFDKYYENKTKAIAYLLGEIITYEEPYSLMDWGIKSAPQSFVYI